MATSYEAAWTHDIINFTEYFSSMSVSFWRAKEASEVNNSQIFLPPACVNATSSEVFLAVCKAVISVLFQMNSNSPQRSVYILSLQIVN